MGDAPLVRRALAEFVGTAFLTLCIIGSGIAATRLSPDESGLQLLINALATGFVLIAIILALGPVSGGQFNPAITLVAWLSGGLDRSAAWVYFLAQVAGAVLGAMLANLIFGLPLVHVAQQSRSGGDLWASEVIATLGLVVVIFTLVRSRHDSMVPFAVGAYITSAILFTSSTAFANPAATFARTLSDTFAGIAPGSAALFVVAELAGALAGWVMVRVLFPD